MLTLDPESIETAVAERAFTGVVAVDSADERIFERASGFAHRALEVPNTVDTQFGIASGSKAFTALAIMRLVEDGNLSLDTPARQILGTDLPEIDDAVTIEHLLTHTSGIGDYLDEEAEWEPSDYVLSVPVHTLTTAEAFLPLVDGFEQSFAPGERWAYCNGSYVVLAIILERVTREIYHDVVRRLVFAPAGLQSTDFLRLDELPRRAALGYLFDEGDRVNTLNLPVLGSGDGGAFTTAADLHGFWRALFAGQIVSPAVVAEMVRPRHVPDEGMRCGMGFFLHATAPAVLIEGYDAGVSFQSTHLPASATTASVLGNSSEGAWPVVRAVTDAIDRLGADGGGGAGG
ncbi:serine hydrolase domain-containing protein [Microbacterium sp. P5_E9]